MNRFGYISASVLATVLVISVLMLLSVLGILAFWDADFVFFSRAGYLSRQRANLESAFVLYSVDSTLADRFDEENFLQLYDSVPESRIRISVQSWGMYEAVRIEASDRRIAAARLFGTSDPFPQTGNFWYATDAASLTLTGRTVLHGYLRLPSHGVQYGQIRSVYFNGERIRNHRIGYAGKELPALRSGARRTTDSLLRLLNTPGEWEMMPDSVTVDFGQTEPRILDASSLLPGVHAEGMAILLGDEIAVDSSCRLQNVLIVGRTIRVGDGFRGRVQLFATDSVLIGRNVTLDYPSGVFVGRANPERYAQIGPDSRIEGYMIVDGNNHPDVRRKNYLQSRTAVLRGLLWVDGTAQIQGIVSGCLAVNKLAYYSTEGYYENMLYDMTLLENQAVAYPLWGAARYRRKEAGWLP